jgi:hypothetical protein
MSHQYNARSPSWIKLQAADRSAFGQYQRGRSSNSEPLITSKEPLEREVIVNEST